MRFLGACLKFLSFLITSISTLICCLVSIEVAEIEAYLFMGLIWVCAMLVSLNVWGTGIALTNISKLKKKNAQLEQRVENLLLAQVSAYRVAPVLANKTEVKPEVTGEHISEGSMVEEVSTASVTPIAGSSTEIMEENAPVSNNSNIKKWIYLAIAGGVLLIFLIILLIIGISKVKPDEPIQNQSIVVETNKTESKEEADKNEKKKPAVNAIPLEVGGAIENECFVMTIDSMEIVDEYSYKSGERVTRSLYVEDGYKLLMVKGLFENNHTTVIKDDCFALAATVNDTYVAGNYDVKLCFERNDSDEIDPYTEMNYVLYMNIPEKLAEQFSTATFTIGFNDDLSVPEFTWDADGNRVTEVDRNYSITSGARVSSAGEAEVEALEKDAMPIKIGDVICTDDYEFTLTNVEMSYEVLPSNTSSVYSSYPAASGKVYIDVEATVKNTMQRDIRIKELFTASLIYDGKYPYSGFTVVDDDNRFDWAGSYVAATPLETCLVHSLIECPVEVDNSGKPVVVYLELGDEIFEYTLR